MTASLDFDQVAPPLFLWLQRLVVVLLGVNDLVVRLVPLLAGIGLIVLMWPIARRVLGGRGGLFATALCAFSPSLVTASAEAKQYIVEGFVACGLVLLVLRWVDLPSPSRWRLLLTLGACSIWAAPSAVFVLGAGWLIILRNSGIGQQAHRREAALSALVWVGSGLLAYILAYRDATNSSYLQHFWKPALLSPGRSGFLLDAAAALKTILAAPIARDSWGIVASGVGALTGVLALVFVTALLGACRLLKCGEAGHGALVILPLALVLLASVVGVYPISARTTAFYVPMFVILLTAGMLGAFESFHRPLAGDTVAVLLSLAVLSITLSSLRDADPREEVKPLVRDLMSRRSGEPLYVFQGAIPAWAWYSTDWTSPDTARLRYLSSIASSGGSAFENAPAWPGEQAGAGLRYLTPAGVELYGTSDGLEAHVFGLRRAVPDPRWAPSEARRIIAEARPGIWLLFAHFYGPEGVLLDRLDAAGGRRVFQDIRNGAALIHYRFPS